MHQLSFGRVRPVGNIVELCIDEGRELTLQSLTEFRTWIGAHMPPRFAVLVTGSLDFSLGFEAQADLGNVAGLQAIAIVRQFPRSDLVFDVIRRLPRDHVLKLELFPSRDSACKWLREHLAVTH